MEREEGKGEEAQVRSMLRGSGRGRRSDSRETGGENL